MSQTEMALLFVLGFSLASLLALFILRMIWAAAVRVGERRMQGQMPSTIAELQAERMRLRVENAELSQRLGAERDEARREAVERLAEVNRHRNRLLAAEAGDSQQLRAKVTELEQALADARLREEELRRALGPQAKEQPKPRRKSAAKKTAAPAPAPAVDERELRLRERIEKLNQLARGQQEGQKQRRTAG